MLEITVFKNNLVGENINRSQINKKNLIMKITKMMDKVSLDNQAIKK